MSEVTRAAGEGKVGKWKVKSHCNTASYWELSDRWHRRQQRNQRLCRVKLAKLSEMGPSQSKCN